MLARLQTELEWAAEGPRPDPEAPLLRWGSVPDWEKLPAIVVKDPDATAVIVDGDLVFGEELAALAQTDAIRARNPRYVVFRKIDAATGAREAIALIRADVAPGSDAISAMLKYKVADPSGPLRAAGLGSATVVGSESTRRASRSR